MKAVCLHDKQEIEAYFRRNMPIHLLEVGDLDNFFWPYTTWYALKDGAAIQALVLMYTGGGLPTLLALTDDLPAMRFLLQSLLYLLPRRFYAHLSGDLASVFSGEYRADSRGTHYKMSLVDPSKLEGVDTSEVIPLGTQDIDDLRALYSASYPGNWFEPRMLETGFYYGVRRDGALVSVAGIHVYSPLYKIGVLGNVTTHPAFRGQRLATATCARLCQELLKTVQHVGLNVKADNISAIRTYERLGFEVVGEYGEFDACMIEWK